MTLGEGVFKDGVLTGWKYSRTEYGRWPKPFGNEQLLGRPTAIFHEDLHLCKFEAEFFRPVDWRPNVDTPDATQHIDKTPDNEPLKRSLWAAFETIYRESATAVRAFDCVLMADQESLARIEALPEIQAHRKSEWSTGEIATDGSVGPLSIYLWRVEIVRCYAAVACGVERNAKPRPYLFLVGRAKGLPESYAVEIVLEPQVAPMYSLYVPPLSGSDMERTRQMIRDYGTRQAIGCREIEAGEMLRTNDIQEMPTKVGGMNVDAGLKGCSLCGTTQGSNRKFCTLCGRQFLVHWDVPLTGDDRIRVRAEIAKNIQKSHDEWTRESGLMVCSWCEKLQDPSRDTCFHCGRGLRGPGAGVAKLEPSPMNWGDARKAAVDSGLGTVRAMLDEAKDWFDRDQAQPPKETYIGLDGSVQ